MRPKTRWVARRSLGNTLWYSLSWQKALEILGDIMRYHNLVHPNNLHRDGFIFPSEIDRNCFRSFTGRWWVGSSHERSINTRNTIQYACDFNVSLGKVGTSIAVTWSESLDSVGFKQRCVSWKFPACFQKLSNQADRDSKHVQSVRTRRCSLRVSCFLFAPGRWFQQVILSFYGWPSSTSTSHTVKNCSMNMWGVSPVVFELNHPFLFGLSCSWTHLVLVEPSFWRTHNFLSFAERIKHASEVA